MDDRVAALICRMHARGMAAGAIASVLRINLPEHALKLSEIDNYIRSGGGEPLEQTRVRYMWKTLAFQGVDDDIWPMAEIMTEMDMGFSIYTISARLEKTMHPEHHIGPFWSPNGVECLRFLGLADRSDGTESVVVTTRTVAGVDDFSRITRGFVSSSWGTGPLPSGLRFAGRPSWKGGSVHISRIFPDLDASTHCWKPETER